MLWKRSLVMKDLETGSLWSHILGEAMRGELKGERLEVLPAVITPWSDWKWQHPKTTVLSLRRTSREFITEFQKHPGRFVLGVGGGAGDTAGYSFDLLAKEKVYNDQLNGEAILVTFDPTTTEAHCFSRELNGKPATFEALPQANRMRDKETGSVWETEGGRCVSGGLKGRELEEIPAIVSFRKAWLDFHPESRMIDRIEESEDAARRRR